MLNRLTKRVSDDYVDNLGRDIRATSNEPTYVLVNRLAEYEDLGSADYFKTLIELQEALENDHK